MQIEKIALATAILGTIALLILSFYLEPKIIEIGQINEKMIDKIVMIRGNITDVKEKEGITIAKIQDNIEDNASIDLIFYKNQKIEKEMYEVIGKVTEYRGKLQIEVQRMKKI